MQMKTTALTVVSTLLTLSDQTNLARGTDTIGAITPVDQDDHPAQKKESYKTMYDATSSLVLYQPNLKPRHETLIQEFVQDFFHPLTEEEVQIVKNYLESVRSSESLSDHDFAMIYDLWIQILFRLDRHKIFDLSDEFFPTIEKVKNLGLNTVRRVELLEASTRALFKFMEFHPDALTSVKSSIRKNTQAIHQNYCGGISLNSGPPFNIPQETVDTLRSVEEQLIQIMRKYGVEPSSMVRNRCAELTSYQERSDKTIRECSYLAIFFVIAGNLVGDLFQGNAVERHPALQRELIELG